MITENEEMKEIKIDKERILSDWRNYYDTMIKNPKPNYDMSEEEFRQGKWLYELNREIEKTISLFPEYTKINAKIQNVFIFANKDGIL